MDVGQLKDDLAIASAMNDGMGRPLHTAILRKAYEGVVALEAQRDELLAALEEIVAREDKAWKPMRVFRSEHQAELDDVRHEVWQEAADMARAAIANARGEG